MRLFSDALLASSMFVMLTDVTDDENDDDTSRNKVYYHCSYYCGCYWLPLIQLYLWSRN